jgi:hypothetical protein
MIEKLNNIAFTKCKLNVLGNKTLQYNTLCMIKSFRFLISVFRILAVT